ncbi:hypothetical protein O9G_004578 [Rozella allomycis CSF55]|uniref:Uncharacterized protein n=1 Tax=Rozella allomycis (strain CSF55) TaxID=988480 RepID=A0A075AXK7_ROZAC|nr:hypothetical protein O9G_004578 [Rozella allomycis CSF55]|eukprot:EPZ34982.1 hypothetical protein O9G_004578 [Rozella allomycis CSF55]
MCKTERMFASKLFVCCNSGAHPANDVLATVSVCRNPSVPEHILPKVVDHQTLQNDRNVTKSIVLKPNRKFGVYSCYSAEETTEMLEVCATRVNAGVTGGRDHKM